MNWRRLFGRRRPPGGVDAELEFHLEMQTRRYEEAGLDHERRLLYLAFASEDAHEGLKAFGEKRPPEFTGR